MRILIVPALALALASCGSAGGGDVKMKPGKWSHTVTMEKFEMPGAPPEMAAAMSGQVGKAQTDESCLTKEQSENSAKQFEEMFAKGQAGCKSENISIAGGKISGTVTCDQPGGVKSVMTMAGTHTETDMNLTMTVDAKNAAMPTADTKMVMKVTGKRTGDCAA